MRAFSLILFIFAFTYSGQALANTILKDLHLGEGSSMLIVDENMKPLYSWQANKPFIPASIQKITTSLLALDKWGRNHRFETEFYVADNILWVKGFGDPFLISEELAVLAQRLAGKLHFASSNIKGIGIDSQFFAREHVHGRTNVDDPYNAPLSAVSANFNTINVIKKNGAVISAESQTPLTATAIRLASKLKNGKHRVNVGTAETAEQHFAELLRLLLKNKGKNIGSEILRGKLPDNAKLVYTHRNSKRLEDVVQASLMYSNNLIANQIFLLLAENNKASINLSQAKKWSNVNLSKRYPHWNNMVFEEGAGLSRKNRISAKQMLDVLIDFSDYKDLLRVYANGEYVAKTGTLKNIRTYAGYMKVKGKNYPFVILLNEKMPYKYREKLVKMALAELNTIN